ncbi:MAG: hypothetical protein IBJ18_13780 [Phycisphaerales bacterium]|nr:hypothetical protein [Phycisphaerales bacterium]
MAREIKAFMFWVTPVDHPASGARDAVVEYMKKPAAFEFSHGGHNYLAEELTWNSQRSILTGTVYRIRTSALPVAVNGTKTHALPLGKDEALGEPMCFAYWPDPGAAVVHYAHNGPRHSVMPALLSKMGYPNAIAVEPVIREDMLQQLQSKQYVQAVEFALSDPDGMQELRDMGGSVGHAIKMLKDLGGVNVRVEVTMGHTKGEGLVVNTAKTIARTLAKIGTTTADDHSPVRTVKVKASDGDDAPLEELDLLRAREPIFLTIDEQGRHLDRTDCQKKLSGALNERKDVFRRQAGNQG